MPHLSIDRRLAYAGCVLVLALGTAPAAFAQATEVEELTVMGHPTKNDPNTETYKVTYRDLDLRTDQGRDELNKRVRITAKYVCRKLGLHEVNSGCYKQAVADAGPAVKEAIHHARTVEHHWKKGPAWTPPPKA